MIEGDRQTVFLIGKNMKHHIIVVLLLSIYSISGAEIVTCSLPFCYRESDSYQLSVDSVSIPITYYSDIYNYAHFSMKGKITVTITAKEEIKTYRISPLRTELEACVNGRTLTFVMERSEYLIVKLNQLPDLILAVDELETDIPSREASNVYDISSLDYNADSEGKVLSTQAIQNAINDASYHGGGIVYIPSGVYLCGNLVLKSNVAIYLEAGAVIRGTGKREDYTVHFRKESLKMDGTWFISTEKNASNIKLYGRGTIDGNGLAMRLNDRFLNNLLVPLQCHSLTVDGIVFRDSGLWGVVVTRSHNVTIKDIKIFNENDIAYENDAMDIQESQNVLVRKAIAVSEDDTYSTKTWSEKTDIASNWCGKSEELKNVVFDNCIGWSRCAAFKIGYGVFQNQSNIIFRNGVAYRCMRAIAINHRYGGHIIDNVLFENIDIEGFWPRKYRDSRWLDISMKNGGVIKNVYLKNIRVRAFGDKPSILKTVTNSFLENVVFENIQIPGECLYAKTLNEMNILGVSQSSGQIDIKIRK